MSLILVPLQGKFGSLDPLLDTMHFNVFIKAMFMLMFNKYGIRTNRAPRLGLTVISILSNSLYAFFVFFLDQIAEMS